MTREADPVREHDDARAARRPLEPSFPALLRGRFTGLGVVLVVLSFCTTVTPDRDVREVVIDIAFTILLVFAIQSLIGPLYLAVLISRLVGMHVARATDR